MLLKAVIKISDGSCCRNGSVFNLALIPTVAVPLSGLRSGKQLALQLQNKYPEKAEIGLYGEYPTSAVFYSGKKLVKLLPQDEIEGFKPKAFSWSSKTLCPMPS